MCLHCVAGENRLEVLKAAPILDRTMEKSEIFNVPILIAAGSHFKSHFVHTTRLCVSLRFTFEYGIFYCGTCSQR